MGPFVNGWPVRVSKHAHERALERLHVGPSTIVRDVEDAPQAGRVSPNPPPGLYGRWDGLYCWTPKVDRIYVLVATRNEFVVATSLNGEAA
jgi:hypothetical protein